MEWIVLEVDDASYESKCLLLACSRETRTILPAEWHSLPLVAAVSRKLMACIRSCPPRWVAALFLELSGFFASLLSLLCPSQHSFRRTRRTPAPGNYSANTPVRRMNVDIIAIWAMTLVGATAIIIMVMLCVALSIRASFLPTPAVQIVILEALLRDFM